MEGFRHAIHISCFFGLEIERNAFVSSLAKFTTLHTVREMKQKNIDCIRTLVALAFEEGNYLFSSWLHILECISQLERLQLLSLGAKTDENFFPTDPSDIPRISRTNTRGSSILGLDMFLTPADRRTQRKEQLRMVDEMNAHTLTGQLGSLDIDRIFTHSTNLHGDAITEFVTQLCKVSRDELQSISGVRSQTEARVFSLQKIVEVADYNMGCRPRILWSLIWDVLSQHFTFAGCLDNVSIAMFAIDSLRQLSMKFMVKDELKNYQFQQKFLKPFETVVKNSPSPKIRELVISCLDNMIQVRSRNIRSGWASVFNTLYIAAMDNHEHLVDMSLQLLERIIHDYFEQIRSSFVECVNCLSMYMRSKFDTVAIRAMDQLKYCARQLAFGRVLISDLEAEEKIHFENTRRLESDPRVAIVHEIEDDSEENGETETSGGGNIKRNGLEKHFEQRDYSESGLEEQNNGNLGDLHSFTEQREVVELFQFTDEQDHLAVWFPILTSLSSSTSDTRLSVRTHSLQSLFSILNDYGSQMDAPLWGLIFRGVLIPLFDDIRYSSSEISMNISTNAGIDTDLSISTSMIDSTQQNSHRSWNDQNDSHSETSKHEGGRGIGTGGKDPRENREWSSLRAPLTPRLLKTMKYGWFAKHSDPISSESVQTAGAEQEKESPKENDQDSWLKTTCPDALNLMVQLYSKYFDILEFLLEDLLSLLESCIHHEMESLARIGVESLQKLVMSTGEKFSGEVWTKFCQALLDIFRLTTPHQLLDARQYLLNDASAFREEFHISVGSLDDFVRGKSLNSKDQEGQVAANYTVGDRVDTPFGEGIVMSIRGDGFVEVNLSWGMAWIQEKSVSAKEKKGISNHAGVDVQEKPQSDESAYFWANETHWTENSTEKKNHGAGGKESEDLSPFSSTSVMQQTICSTLPFNGAHVVTMCIIQLELINFLGDIASHYHNIFLPMHHMMLLECLETSVTFAFEFNKDYELRTALWHVGFMRFVRPIKLPNLLRQESAGLTQYLCMLFRLYTDANHENKNSRGEVWGDLYTKVEEKLMNSISDVVQRYSALERQLIDSEGVIDDSENGREAQTLTRILLHILKGVRELSTKQFTKNIGVIFPVLKELIHCESRDVRTIVAAIFSEKIYFMLNIP